MPVLSVLFCETDQDFISALFNVFTVRLCFFYRYLRAWVFSYDFIIFNPKKFNVQGIFPPCPFFPGKTKFQTSTLKYIGSALSHFFKDFCEAGLNSADMAVWRPYLQHPSHFTHLISLAISISYPLLRWLSRRNQGGLTKLKKLWSQSIKFHIVKWDFWRATKNVGSKLKTTLYKKVKKHKAQKDQNTKQKNKQY